MYNFQKSSAQLIDGGLELKTGDSGMRLCYGGDEGEGWEQLEGGTTYVLVVEATSQLFGTVGTESFEFSYSNPPSSSSSRFVSSVSSSHDNNNKRQTSLLSCEQLWDNSPWSLYGLQLYPSGNNYFPASLRSKGLTVLLKGLTSCENSQITKEIVSQGNITWTFLDDVEGLDANDFSSGTRLYIPPSVLLSTFTPSVVYRIGVTFEWGEEEGQGGRLSSEMSFEFLAGGVEFVLEGDTGGGAIHNQQQLVLDFRGSMTQDEMNGLVGEGQQGQWSWQWGCVNGVTGEPCRYQDGDQVVMPSAGGLFVSEPGKTWEVGAPMLFVVRVVVDGVGGQGVARGEWERVYFGVEHQVEWQLERVEWECLVGGNGQGYNVC